MLLLASATHVCAGSDTTRGGRLWGEIVFFDRHVDAQIQTTLLPAVHLEPRTGAHATTQDGEGISIPFEFPTASDNGTPVPHMPADLHGPTVGPVNSTRLWLVGGTIAAVNAGIMYYYFTTFYSPRESDRTKWHTFNDWYNADLNVDKLGHMWGTQVYSNTAYHIFRWTNMSETASMWWASSLALVLQCEMEMTDAYYKLWGWSWWDVGANAVGAFWPTLQRSVPELQTVNLKMSYRPSQLITKRWVNYVLKDYDGFTYWLAFSVEDLLPRAFKPWWPDWLGIAVGYGAANTVYAKGAYNTDKNNRGLGDQEWYIALDYDLRKLPGDTPFLKFLKEQFNMFHLPSPAVRIAPSAVWFGLFF